MSKLESDLRNVFKNIFKLNLRKINKKTNYKNTKNWDSLNHVKLIMAIESKFKISIDPDQSINFISFDQILKYLRKKIIYNSKLIVIGFQAYNYYINKIDKKEKINIPYYEIISTQLNDDALMIYKKLLRKFKNVKVKQYIPFFEFFDNKIEYYVDDKLILVLYGNNERCIVYNYSEKKHCYFGTFNLVVMYILFNYFYAYINKFKEKKNIYYLLLIKLITYRNNYLEERNKTILDDTPFKDFSLKCFGKSVELKRLSFLEGSKKIKKGQKPKEKYKPSGKIPKIVPKNYINISGNEISNEKYFIIKKNNI